MDFDQLEAVVASVMRVETYNRSSYCIDTFMAAQTDHKGIKGHLDALTDTSLSGKKTKPKAEPFSLLQSRISSLGI